MNYITQKPNLSALLRKIQLKNTTRVMLVCNWTSSKELCDTWNKMSKGNYTWNKVQITWEEPVDYYVVINRPPTDMTLPLEKTILFQMEPNMATCRNLWGDWSIPPLNLLFRGTHDVHYNNNEWWLSKTYTELCTYVPEKTELISAIVSDKYSDPGHIKRIDFLKFVETKNIDVHVYGGNRFKWKNYKGQLPYHQKDDGLFKYKYTFNAENNDIPGYFTEKLIDGILAECLVFYWGCPNIYEFIDKRAFVKMELSNFEIDVDRVKLAISNNLWEERLPYIREAKKKILNELQFFPRLEKILESK